MKKVNCPGFDLVSFTASVPVGKYIAETAGYRRTILELGGNAPLIVMDDADRARNCLTRN